MAITLSFESEHGVTGAYWKVIRVKIVTRPVAGLEVTYGKFVDSDAHTNNKSPLETRIFTWPKNTIRSAVLLGMESDLDDKIIELFPTAVKV